MPLRDYHIQTRRGLFRARQAGYGRVVLLLHGITANSAIWDPTILRLGSALRAIAIDQRGHGLSDKPPSGYSALDYAEDAIAVIEALEAGPAVIVGHSLGARNSIVAAALRPDVVRGVVAIDFTPFIETSVFDSLDERVKGGDREFASRREVTEYLRTRYPKLPGDAIDRRATYGYTVAGTKLRPLADPTAMIETAAGLREDLGPPVMNVECPTLVIRGADSRLVSSAAFERTRLLRPDFKAIVVDRVDHYVPEEAPERTSTAIARFEESLV